MIGAAYSKSREECVAERLPLQRKEAQTGLEYNYNGDLGQLGT